MPIYLSKKALKQEVDRLVEEKVILDGKNMFRQVLTECFRLGETELETGDDFYASKLRRAAKDFLKTTQLQIDRNIRDRLNIQIDNSISSKIQNEKFIDEIVERINRKQVGK